MLIHLDDLRDARAHERSAVSASERGGEQGRVGVGWHRRRLTVSLRQPIGSLESSCDFCSRRLQTSVAHHSEMRSPLTPCPSNTQMMALLYVPLKGQHTSPRSWLIFALEATPFAPRAGAMPWRVIEPMTAGSNSV